MGKLPLIVRKLQPLSRGKVKHVLGGMSDEQLKDLLTDWDMWCLPHQRLPDGEWRRWLLRGGRGSGKTQAGSGNTNKVAQNKDLIRHGDIGVIGRTFDAARTDMVEGSSGILATAPHDFRPEWQPGKKTLTWPNGVRGLVLSADKPEQIRGKNFSLVWADEPPYWEYPKEAWWEAIEPALRIGWARAILTCTPRADPFLLELEKRSGTIVTNASMYDNPFLNDVTLAMFREQYEGTRIGRQELYGEYVLEAERALWTHDMIDDARVDEVPADISRVVVGVDPAVSAHEHSDETGLIAAALGFDKHAYVLQDRSLKGTPYEWAKRAVAMYKRWGAGVMVAEVNNGGDLVESNIRGIDDRVNVKQVRASRGKIARIEPVVALYERKRIHHVGHHEELEDQMVTWEPHMAMGKARSRIKSPDRIDALAWCIHELMLEDVQPVGPIEAYL